MAIAASEDAVDQIVAALDQIGLRVGNAERDGESGDESRDEANHEVPPAGFVGDYT
jgi:hypothetical protein